MTPVSPPPSPALPYEPQKKQWKSELLSPRGKNELRYASFSKTEALL
jgi:hypothetical protein